MTEADCLEYCYQRGFFWEENGVRLYDILDRVSCWCCKNKNRKELKAIYQYLPHYWSLLKELQAQIPIPMKPYSRKGVPCGNLFDLEKVFEQGDPGGKHSQYPRSREKRRRLRQSDSGGKHHLHIELTQRQYQLLCRQARECGLTKRAFLVRLIEGTPVKARPAQEIRALRTEIHHIGNNINQIARSVNAGIARPEDARRGLYLLDQVYELMYQVAKK